MSEIEATEGVIPEVIDSGEVAEDVNEEATSTSEDTAEDAAEPQKPKAKGVQKRLDELTRLRYDAERDRDHWREVALRNQPQPKAPEPTPQPTQGKPSLDQFESYEAYTEALTDWKVGEALRAQERQMQERTVQTEAQRRQEEFQSRVSAFSAEVEDFHQVAMNPSLPVSDAMAEAIQSSDIGPQLLYHLGQNPQEAARIAGLPPYLAAMELGRLSARLTAPQPRRNPSAPAPVKPLGGGEGLANTDPLKLSPDDWARQRNAELAARRK